MRANLTLSEPLALEEIAEKYLLPVVIRMDCWDNKLKFLLTNLSKVDGRIKVKGRFIYHGPGWFQQMGVICIFCKFRVSIDDPDIPLPE
jgi:hypothetical protein